MTPLCTAGYEGRTADDLVQLLAENDIEIVIDVRERPLSRKRGLSKSSLEQRLAAEGVDYLHLRDLGNPKRYRDALKDGWAFEEFAAEFMALLELSLPVLAELGEVAASKRACLLCFEADPNRCHRSLVAKALADWLDGDFEVVHLGHGC
ncbi:MAG: DUF488 domain-containing protein [Coriobacteriales bacterium]|nr:DUF488 domain-containing protein [Coriobacteriales bacterium]